MTRARIKIFTGHFGSGKTEVAVNFAAGMAFNITSKPTSDIASEPTSDIPSKPTSVHAPQHLQAASYSSVAIADLDIVNPYFRTADVKSTLEKLGVKTIIPPYAGTNVDVPALPAQINMIFEDSSCMAVLDVGGDDSGARVLGGYRDRIVEAGYDMYLVVNARRPETSSAEGIIMTMKSIEKSSGLKVTGLVNNTNLLAETTADIIADGRKIIEEAVKKTGVPIAFTAVMESVVPEADLKSIIDEPVLYLKKYIKLPF